LTNLAGASCVAARLREILAAVPISTSAGPLAVTVSIGVTALETAQELETISIAELPRAADRLLYVSKNLGRDRATAALVDPAATVPSGAPAGAENEVN
jgi:PleD family two-component response regulator